MSQTRTTPGAGRVPVTYRIPTGALAKWADQRLRSLCQSSIFDRIIFWERPRRWYKWLKPEQPVVCYGS